MTTPPYDELIAHITDRSAVLRDAARDNLDSAVPGCPGWTARDLVAHLGGVQRFWAAVVTADPAEDPPSDVDEEPHDKLIDWGTESTVLLVDALAEAGPDRRAWTWWREPRTAGAIARHQVQEAAVHARDAQEAAGLPQPLPADVAHDGVEEFLAVEMPLANSWPEVPATLSLSATGVPSAWRVRLSRDGARVSRGEPGGEAVIRGDASDLVLGLYRRIGADALDVGGDRALAERFLAWTKLD